MTRRPTTRARSTDPLATAAGATVDPVTQSVDPDRAVGRTAREPSEGRPNYPIESVDNALRLVLMFRQQQSIRLSEVSDVIGVARSTAHRLLAMLQYHGFVVQDPLSKAYVAGPALVDVGLSVVRSMDIRVQARPLLERLAAQVGETVHLVQLQGTIVAYLDSVESSKPLRVASRTGMTLPAHCTSVGKALLAELGTQQLHALYPDKALPGLTRRSVRTRAALERELATVKSRGYALSEGESEDDVGAVGIALRDTRGQARAALSIAMPLSRMTAAKVIDVIAAAQAMAGELGELLP